MTDIDDPTIHFVDKQDAANPDRAVVTPNGWLLATWGNALDGDKVTARFPPWRISSVWTGDDSELVDDE